MNATGQFTAAQIAAAIGLKAPTVREHLRDVKPAGVRMWQAMKQPRGRWQTARPATGTAGDGGGAAT